MRAIFALLLLLLAACATIAAPSSDLPTRAAVDAALERWDFACWDAAQSDPNLDCVPVAKRLVRRARCRPDRDADHPARILCRFSGVYAARGLPHRRFGPECAWLTRAGGGPWRIEGFPDAEFCS